LVRREAGVKVVVTGLPKSGTTAIFYAFAAALRDPATLFEPSRLARSFAKRHARDDMVAKTLLMPGVDHASFSGFDRKVLIIRDPRDVLVSLILYLTGYHILWRRESELSAYVSVLKQKERDPASVSLRELCLHAAPNGMPRFVQDRFDPLLGFLSACGSGYFRVRYEDFVSGKTDELSAYAGFPVSSPARPDGHARVFRTGSSGAWRHWMTPDDVSEFEPLLRPHMAAARCEPNWELSPSQCIRTEHASGYIIRIANEHRERRRKPPFRQA